MKRNELLAKSLTLGLAVATAATSMSVPGGLLAPETVYAEETRTVLSEENVKDYFEILIPVMCYDPSTRKMDGPIIKCLKQDETDPSTNAGKKYGNFITEIWKSDDSGQLTDQPIVGEKYNIYINVDGKGSELAPAEKSLKLGTVTLYEDPGSNKVFKCKDGENGNEIEIGEDFEKNELVNDAIIIAPDGMTISTSENGEYASTVTISRGNILGGAKTVVLYIKDNSKTYAKLLTVYFQLLDSKPALSGNISLTGEAIVGAELTASVENGVEGASYKYEFVRVADDKTETIVQAASYNSIYTITKNDKGSKIKVIVTADDYSGTLETATAVITDKTSVDISIKENVSNLTYDGTSKSISYEVKQGETTISDIDGKLAVTITKNGEVVSEIKDAGTYVVTAEYSDDTNYGKLVQEITVTPKKIASVDDLKKCFKIGDLNLTYDMTDHRMDIYNAVDIIEGSGIEFNDYDVRIEGDTVNAGDSATVSIKTWDGNYYTDDYVTLGNARISKGTIALKVTADSKGTPTIKVGDKTIANDDSHIELKYYDKDDKELDTKPTAPGTYKVKVTYTDEANLTAPATGEADFTITNSSSGGSTSGGSSSGGSSSGGSTSGGSSAGGGASTTPSKDDSKKDDTTKTETKPDGTIVTTTETKAADGSVQTKIELKNDTTGVNATVNVAKDAQGKITGATADVNQKATDNKTAISAASIAQITEAAGTKDVEITTRTVDADGKTVREVTVNASDLTAGKKLKVVAVDPETGEKTLVNKTTYKVAADGSLALDNLGNANYEVVTTTEVNALTKEILQSIRPEKSKANIVAGKKTSLSLDDALNMDNVAKITYKTSKKSVATVNSNGTITAKKAGKVTIKATVTLNNGKKKTIRMNLTVKARK